MAHRFGSRRQTPALYADFTVRQPDFELHVHLEVGARDPGAVRAVGIGQDDHAERHRRADHARTRPRRARRRAALRATTGRGA